MWQLLESCQRCPRQSLPAHAGSCRPCHAAAWPCTPLEMLKRLHRCPESLHLQLPAAPNGLRALQACAAGLPLTHVLAHPDQAAPASSCCCQLPGASLLSSQNCSAPRRGFLQTLAWPAQALRRVARPGKTASGSDVSLSIPDADGDVVLKHGQAQRAMRNVTRQGIDIPRHGADSCFCLLSRQWHGGCHRLQRRGSVLG